MQVAVVDVAAVGRGVPEDADLAVEPGDAAPDDGQPSGRGLVGDDVAGVERVAAVDDDVVPVEDRGGVGREPDGVHDDVRVGGGRPHALGGDPRLRQAHVPRSEEHLTL